MTARQTQRRLEGRVRRLEREGGDDGGMDAVDLTKASLRLESEAASPALPSEAERSARSFSQELVIAAIESIAASTRALQRSKS